MDVDIVGHQLHVRYILIDTSIAHPKLSYQVQTQERAHQGYFLWERPTPRGSH